MESTGRADCVQLSAAAFRVACLPPGSLPLLRLDVKGKGIMDTHIIGAFAADAPGVRALLAAPMPVVTPRASADDPSPAAGSAAAAGGDFVAQPDDLGGDTFNLGMPGPERRTGSPDRRSIVSDGSTNDFGILSYGSDATLLRSGSLRTPTDTSDGSVADVTAASTLRLLRASLPGVQSTLAGGFFLLLLAATTPRASLYAAAPLLLKLAALFALSKLAAMRAARLASFAMRGDEEAAQVSAAAETMSQLYVALALAHSEADILRSGCDTAMALFPGAVACALGVFAEGADCSVVSWLECGGDEAARRALSDTLSANAVGASELDGSAGLTSVSRICLHDGADVAPLDSRQLPGGLDACRDWAATASLGLNAAAAVTAKLVAGHVTVGFVQLYFGLFSGRRAAGPEASVLGELADAVAGAIFVRRALAINRDEAPTVAATGTGVSRRMSDPNYALEAVDAAMEAAAARNDAAQLAQLDASAAEDHATLLTWGLDAWALPDAEVQRLMMAMMHGVGVLRRFQIRPTAFAAFMVDVAAHYADNPFHNFRHSFMVCHACWLFLSDLSVRNGLLEELDVLALLLSAICHDLEHPGTTNAFQVNTGSVLALRYNGAWDDVNGPSGCC
jgi:hypothetical protein